MLVTQEVLLVSVYTVLYTDFQRNIYGWICKLQAQDV